MTNSITEGRHGESIAQKFLEQQGFSLITQNYYARYGEIDLIMSDEKILIFVKVGVRNNPYYCSAIVSITDAKMEKFRQKVEIYHQEHPTDQPVRIDVIVIQDSHIPNPEIEWVHNAF